MGETYIYISVGHFRNNNFLSCRSGSCANNSSMTVALICGMENIIHLLRQTLLSGACRHSALTLSLCILPHKSLPSRSILGSQHNRTALTQNSSGSIKINVCAKTEPPVEHAPHAPASLDFSFPNFPVPRTVFLTLSRRPLHAHSLEHPSLPRRT